MIFEKFANLKYKYGNRHFWCRGFYVDTVGKNKKAIEDYIRNQEQEDMIAYQISLNEMLNWVKSEENRLKIPDSKTFYFSDEKDNDNYDFKTFKVFNSDEDIKHLRDIIKTEIEGVNNQYSIFKIIVNIRFGSLNFYFRNKKI